MKKILAALVAMTAIAACGDTAGDAQTATDTLTRRQKDSLIAEMPLPGAGAVGRALDAQDAARERAERLESMN